MMKKIIKLLTALLIVSLPFTNDVRAEHYPLEETNWRVTFDGSELKDNFGGSAVTEIIRGMQPGDTADISVKIRNDYGKAADFYMENSVIRSFEDESVIQALQYGGYVYELWYAPASGAAEYAIYQSNKVGGESEDASAKKEDLGLHQATEGLENYFWLEKIDPGKEGTVRIHIELDGASQANIYQDTFGELVLDFAVELPTESRVIKIPHTGAEFRGSHLETVTRLISGLSLVVLIVSAFILLFVKERKEPERER